MDKLEQLVEAWSNCKKAEQMTIETRRKIEDEITDYLELDLKQEGTVNLDVSGFKLRIALRRNRKVDPDLLQEVAAEHGLENLLSSLFRWKAEVDTKSWRATSPEVQNILSKAITTTAGRPSYLITEE